MTDKIQVSPERLKTAGSTWSMVHADSIEQTRNTISQAIYSYTPGWTGDSAEAFEGMWKVWGSVFNDIHAGVEQVAVFLKEAGLAYEQMDKDLSTIFKTSR